MDFIYPKTNSKIYLTKNFNSEIQPVIFKVAYSQREKQLFWYVDHVYKGVTKVFHEKPIIMNAGFHYITVVDESGNEITRKVEIIRE
jgi:penicillin-binding protein 1C